VGTTVAALRASLHCHAACKNSSVKTIEVTVQRLSAVGLRLSYLVQGDVDVLRIPGTLPATCRDGLWHHTCAELFIAELDREAYFEFNFSTSTEWAAYEFSAYRHDMRMIECDPPVIHCQQTPTDLLLQVGVMMPALALSDRWQLGLTMVIEEAQGQLSYWALSHGGERPDFHRRDSFVLTI
jgi:hypothetical protein